jgi:Tfp pilus assembly protein FimT
MQTANFNQLHQAARPRGFGGRARRAYSLIEMLITVLIIQILSGMVIVSVSNVNRAERLSRAGQQVINALRYARVMAMSDGGKAGVEFNATTNIIRVYRGDTKTTVPNTLFSSGTYVVNLNTQMDCSGVTIGTCNLASAPSNPYQINFGNLGGTDNNGTVTLNYGGVSKVITIPLVGEATMQ